MRDANEAVMAIYQQTVFHASGTPGCVRKPNNPAGAPDWENDGVVEIPWSCDNCRLGAVGLIGGEWNPWQEDYDKDGLGDACDPCPFQKQPLGAPCTGLPIELPQPEQWTGVATTTKLAELPIYGSERLGLMRPNVLRDTVIVINPTPSIFTRRVDQKEYELKDHLGNVRVVVSDMKKRVGDLTATFTLRVKSVNAYYAFGMLEEGMSGSSEGYRYGFNGKESDNEISGTGNQYDYGFRIYNPRLGKFLSVDPLTKDYPSWSPYPFAMNRPIDGIDLDGLEWQHYNRAYEQTGGDFGSSGPVYDPIEDAKNASSKARKPSIKEKIAAGMALNVSSGYPEVQAAAFSIFNAILPDALNIGIGGSAVLGVGVQANAELTFVLNGPDNSLDPRFKFSAAGASGIDLSFGPYVGVSSCSAPYDYLRADGMNGTEVGVTGAFILSGSVDVPPIQDPQGESVGRWYQANVGKPGISLYSFSFGQSWITDVGIVEGTSNAANKVAEKAEEAAQTIIHDFHSQTGLSMPSGPIMP